MTLVIILTSLFVSWVVVLFLVARGAIYIEEMVIEDMRLECDSIQ